MKRTRAMLTLIKPPSEKPSPAALQSAKVPFAHEAWDALLKKHVDDKGRVAYGNIDAAALDQVLAGIAASSPKKTPAHYATKQAQPTHQHGRRRVRDVEAGPGKTREVEF